MIKVQLPGHLRKLAGVTGEVILTLPEPAGETTAARDASPSQSPVQRVTIAQALDELEARYPVLRGAIRDRETGRRRAFVRYFACQQDLSHEPPDAPLPDLVASGQEALLIIGAMAGG